MAATYFLVVGSEPRFYKAMSGWLLPILDSPDCSNWARTSPRQLARLTQSTRKNTERFAPRFCLGTDRLPISPPKPSHLRKLAETVPAFVFLTFAELRFSVSGQLLRLPNGQRSPRPRERPCVYSLRIGCPLPNSLQKPALIRA